MKYKKDSIAFIVESNRTVRKVVVVRVTGDFYIVKFEDNGGVIQIRGSRLFVSEEEALASLPQKEQSTRTGYRSPYEYWH